MNNYTPTYPILNSNDLVPRNEMKLSPESELTLIQRVELNNLRRGVPYHIVVPDTPQNRESISVIACYYQMVAYMEGWTFDPSLYQVVFLDPQDSRLDQEGEQVRILEFESSSATPVNSRLESLLSPKRHLGFRVMNKETGDGELIDAVEADGLCDNVIDLFRRK